MKLFIDQDFKPGPIVYLVAGNLRQAQNWADDHKLKRNAWRYISSVEQLKGIHRANIRFVGTWWTRKDRDEVDREASIAGM